MKRTIWFKLNVLFLVSMTLVIPFVIWVYHGNPFIDTLSANQKYNAKYTNEDKHTTLTMRYIVEDHFTDRDKDRVELIYRDSNSDLKRIQLYRTINTYRNSTVYDKSFSMIENKCRGHMCTVEFVFSKDKDYPSDIYITGLWSK